MNSLTPQLHEAGNILVIGDLHGQAAHLDQLLEGAQFRGWLDGSGCLAADTHMVFMGDFIDGGKQAREVIGRVMALREANPGRVHTVLGNHEMLALASLAPAQEMLARGGGDDDYAWTPHGCDGGWWWMREFGGLEPYLEAMRADAPVGAFLRSLEPAVELHCGESRVLFVHGGIPERIGLREDLEAEVASLRDLVRTEAALASLGFNVRQDPRTGPDSLLCDRSIPRRRRVGVDFIPAALGVDAIVIGHTRQERITRYGSAIYAVDVHSQPILSALLLRAGEPPQELVAGASLRAIP